MVFAKEYNSGPPQSPLMSKETTPVLKLTFSQQVYLSASALGQHVDGSKLVLRLDDVQSLQCHSTVEQPFGQADGCQ